MLTTILPALRDSVIKFELSHLLVKLDGANSKFKQEKRHIHFGTIPQLQASKIIAIESQNGCVV